MKSRFLTVIGKYAQVTVINVCDFTIAVGQLLSLVLSELKLDDTGSCCLLVPTSIQSVVSISQGAAKLW